MAPSNSYRAEFLKNLKKLSLLHQRRSYNSISNPNANIVILDSASQDSAVFHCMTCVWVLTVFLWNDVGLSLLGIVNAGSRRVTFVMLNTVRKNCSSYLRCLFYSYNSKIGHDFSWAVLFVIDALIFVADLSLQAEQSAHLHCCRLLINDVAFPKFWTSTETILYPNASADRHILYIGQKTSSVRTYTYCQQQKDSHNEWPLMYFQGHDNILHDILQRQPFRK